MILGITGSREWLKVKVIYDYIWNEYAVHGDDLIVMHGGCKTGADNITDKLCRQMGVTQLIVPAEWERYKRVAGPIRNKRMIGYKPYKVIAFNLGTPGTEGMMELTEKAGIPLLVVEG